MDWLIHTSERMARGRVAEQSVPVSRSGALIATDRFNAIRYYDKDGKVFHQYDLPDDLILKDYTRHYFRYMLSGPSGAVTYSLKFGLTQTLLHLIRTLSLHRNECSLLEIGSTIGETYHLMRSLLALEKRPIELEFVGLDLSQNCTAFSRDLFPRDLNFQSVVGEASDLSRFPDETFDLICSNGVHNHVRDQGGAVREAVRVCRIAAVLQLIMSSGDSGRRFKQTVERQGDFWYQAPTPDELFSYFPEPGRYHWYVLTPSSRRGAKFDDHRYVEIDDPEVLRWYTVIIAKYPILSGKIK